MGIAAHDGIGPGANESGVGGPCGYCACPTAPSSTPGASGSGCSESRGHRVDLVSAARWHEGGREVPLVARAGEQVVGARTLGSHPALFVYDPRPLWRALGRPVDVIDVHEEPFALATAEVLLLRWLRRQRAPYVLYTAQNIDKRYPVPFRWIERAALRERGASAPATPPRRASPSARASRAGPARSTSAPTSPASAPPSRRRRQTPPSADADRPSWGMPAGSTAAKGVDVLLRAAAIDPATARPPRR